MNKHLSPATSGSHLDGTALPQRDWHPSDGAATSDGSYGCHPVEYPCVDVSIDTEGHHLPPFTQQHADRTGAVEPIPALRLQDAGYLGDRGVPAPLGGPAHAADSRADEEARRLEGRVALLMRLLDDDGQRWAGAEKGGATDGAPPAPGV
jgi:hypothetical protein